MEHSIEYELLMSGLVPQKTLKETEKVKISVVYDESRQSYCVLRICKKRDLSSVYQSLRKIRNPNTVVIHDFVYENGDTYILEEYVEGTTLEEKIEHCGNFSEKETAKIIIEVCKALDELHREQPPIVHNDINPSNIKIRDDGSVKLFDFDISRTYKKGQNQNTTLFGTEEYASPEHFGYGQSEPRTDIYCLGVTMHKMLTGKALSGEHQMVYNGKLKKIIRKCLEIDPKNRYSSVAILKKDLENFLLKKKYTLRNIAIGSGICTAVLCVAGGAVFFGLIGNPELLEDFVPGFSQSSNTGSSGDGFISKNSSFNSSEESSSVPETSSSGAMETQSVPEEQTASSEENYARETAKPIALESSVEGSLETELDRWYKFTSGNLVSSCRISISKGKGSTNTLFPFIYAVVYDSVGIKVEEFNIWSDEEFAFIDFYPEPGSEYFVKVYLGGRYEYGEYEICVSEMVCDAGINKESAKRLIIGERNFGTLDSILSDWYRLEIEEDGEYLITVHNIDVGCSIYMSLQKPNSAGEGRSILNEDNYSFKINSKAGDIIYMEIRPYQENDIPKGKYIIEIEPN